LRIYSEETAGESDEADKSEAGVGAIKRKLESWWTTRQQRGLEAAE
jgi:hypothetical protein